MREQVRIVYATLHHTMKPSARTQATSSRGAKLCSTIINCAAINFITMFTVLAIDVQIDVISISCRHIAVSFHFNLTKNIVMPLITMFNMFNMARKLKAVSMSQLLLLAAIASAPASTMNDIFSHLPLKGKVLRDEWFERNEKRNRHACYNISWRNGACRLLRE